MTTCLFRMTLAGALALAALTSAACVGPHDAAPRAVPLTGREVGVQFALSDTLPAVGDTVTVSVRIHSPGEAVQVTSYTARLTFDTTGLRLVGEAPLADGATRVINPTSGAVRAAGIAPAGFAAGELFALRFAVLRPTRLASLAVHFDEIHSAAREDLKSRLWTMPETGVRLP